MEAIYKLNANEIDQRLIETIKNLFAGKEITMTITSEPDETTYLAMNPANENHLLEGIASEPFVSFTAQEFDKHVEDLLKQVK